MEKTFSGSNRQLVTQVKHLLHHCYFYSKIKTPQNHFNLEEEWRNGVSYLSEPDRPPWVDLIALHLGHFILMNNNQITHRGCLRRRCPPSRDDINKQSQTALCASPCTHQKVPTPDAFAIEVVGLYVKVWGEATFMPWRPASCQLGANRTLSNEQPWVAAGRGLPCAAQDRCTWSVPEWQLLFPVKTQISWCKTALSD